MSYTSGDFRDLRFREATASVVALIGSLVATWFAVTEHTGWLAPVSGGLGFISGAAWQIACYWGLRMRMAELSEATR